jgi:hypothetical protein
MFLYHRFQPPSPSFRGLFSQVLGFSASRFMPTFTVPFISGFVYSRFLYKRTRLESTIYEHQVLGAHTDVVCFEYSRENQSTTVTKYVWSHPGLKPYGQTLETQCPGCKGLRTWARKGAPQAEQITLRCKAAGCSQERVFSMPVGMAFVRGGDHGDERGAWMKITLLL